MSFTFLLTTDPGVVQAAITNMVASEVNPCGAVFTSPDAPVPLFRSFNAATNGHLYTTYIDEYDDSLNDGSHFGEGIVCYCFAQPPSSGQSVQPVYRGYNSKTDDHLYTLDPGEIYFTDGAYTYEGIVFYVFSNSSDGIPFYRMRDSTGAQHVYTADEKEHQQYLAGGFVDDGLASPLGYVTSNVNYPSSIGPLYGTYNAKNGSHFYTMDFVERNNATNNLGMIADGIACYIHHDGMQPSGTTQLYRAYNHAIDAHVYTIDPSELNDLVTNRGYESEGIAGWVLPHLLSPVIESRPISVLHRVYGDFTNNFLVPTPSLGLASSTNYTMNNVIAGRCNPIRGLTVEIDVTTDIVCAAVDFGLMGFGFQLNCQSINSAVTGWQQYVVYLDGISLSSMIDNWIINSAANSGKSDHLTNLPNFTLPKGYKITIQLIEDKIGNIVGAASSVFDDKGKRIGHTSRMVSTIAQAKAIGVAQIGSFQVVLVGAINRSDSTLSSGQGTFTYTTSTPIRPGAALPACVNGYASTGESANSIYGPMQAKRDRKFVQSFGIGSTGPSPRSYKRYFAGANFPPQRGQFGK